jgi:hypothetical protein
VIGSGIRVLAGAVLWTFAYGFVAWKRSGIEGSMPLGPVLVASLNRLVVLAALVWCLLQSEWLAAGLLAGILVLMSVMTHGLYRLLARSQSASQKERSI